MLDFESAGTAARLVRRYGRAPRGWALSIDNSFWKAIKHAHELGYRGRGARVAIVDSGCDLSLPKLRESVDGAKSFVSAPPDEDSIGHGTAVALLLTEVAPECRLDIYRVAAEGKPDERAVIQALDAASASDVTVINISLAARRPFNLSAEQVAASLAAGDGSGRKHAVESQPCELCLAAMRASAGGKLLFAAAGNKPGTAACPAHADGVAAVGFKGRESRTTALPTGGLQQLEFPAMPKAAQTSLLDLSLAEMPGAIGTSFATPMFAGVGALGLTKEELAAYIDAIAAVGLPEVFHALIRAGSVQGSIDLVGGISALYNRSDTKLPHIHCDYQAILRNGALMSDPSKCPYCGIIAEPNFVNHGLWLLSTRRTAVHAKSMLEASCAIAPWSADAVANLGATMRKLGDVQRAIALYRRALELRPNFRVYEYELKNLTQALAGRGG